MAKEYEQLTTEQKETIRARIGELAEIESVMRDAIVELIQIQTQYVRALGQPTAVAQDTVDPLPDRLRTAFGKIHAVTK